MILEQKLLDALLQKIGSEEAVQKIVSGELVISEPPKWIETNAVILCSITSNGFTEEQWIEKYQEYGIKLPENYLGYNFKPREQGIIIEFAFYRGIIFEGKENFSKRLSSICYEHYVPEGYSYEEPTREEILLFKEKFVHGDFFKNGSSTGTVYITSEHDSEDYHRRCEIISSPYFNGDTYFEEDDRFSPDDGGFLFVLRK